MLASDYGERVVDPAELDSDVGDCGEEVFELREA
jgi:hypothetical protein